jgi:hypothetical protein
MAKPWHDINIPPFTTIRKFVPLQKSIPVLMIPLKIEKKSLPVDTGSNG